MDARPGTLIDLDLAPRVADGEVPQRRRALPADFRRRAGLAGCLVLVLLTVARAAPPPPPSLVEVWLRDVGSPMEFAVSGDRLVVTAAPEATPPTTSDRKCAVSNRRTQPITSTNNPVNRPASALMAGRAPAEDTISTRLRASDVTTAAWPDG